MNNTFVDNLVKIATTNSVSGDASDIDMDALQSSAIAAGTADPRLVAQFAASPNVLQVAPQNLYATTPNYLPYTVGSGVAAGTLLASRTVRNGVAAGLPFGLKNRQLYDALLGNTGSSATSPLMRQIFGGSRDAAGKVSFTARTAPTDIEKYLTGLREGTSFSTGIELRPYGYGGKSMAEWNTPASGRWITKPFRLAANYLGGNQAAGQALEDIKSEVGARIGSKPWREILADTSSELSHSAHSGRAGAILAGMATLAGVGTYGYQRLFNKLPDPRINPDLVAIQRERQADQVKDFNAILSTDLSKETGKSNGAQAPDEGLSLTQKILLAAGIPLAAYGGYRLYNNLKKKKNSPPADDQG